MYVCLYILPELASHNVEKRVEKRAMSKPKKFAGEVHLAPVIRSTAKCGVVQFPVSEGVVYIFFSS